MSLGDVVVERKLSNTEARQAICALWNLQDNEVLIVNDLGELVFTNQPRRVLCHKWDLDTGQFSTVLSFHEGEFTELPRIPTAEKLSHILKCRCLISDSSDNPYTMILIGTGTKNQLVSLMPDQLDNGQYEIAGMAQ